MKTGYSVSDVMTVKPVVIKPGSTLEDCARLMSQHRIGTLIVSDGAELLGVLNDTDIIRNVLAKGINPLAILVEDVMQKRLITAKPNQDMYEALLLMKSNSVRTLPVVESGKLMGILTLKDILKIEPALFETIAEKIRLREESRKPINRFIEKEGICQICGKYTEEIFIDGQVLVCRFCKD